MVNKKVEIITSASVANVSCGFDCLGYSIPKPFDTIQVSKRTDLKIKISTSGSIIKNIPLSPEQNTAGAAAISILRKLNINQGLNINIKKGIPAGSGLGSSAASAVGAAKGINELLHLNMSQMDLLHHSLQGEKVSSGIAHADNIAPALFGGITLISNYDPLDIIHLPIPMDLHSTTILPSLVLNTKESRTILPKSIPLKSAVNQNSNLASFVASLYTDNFDLMRRSLSDLFAEPYRKKLIPHFDEIKESAILNGAIGCGISGSGPSIFALSTTEQIALRIGNTIQTIFGKYGIHSKYYFSKINTRGAKIVR